MEDVWKEYKTQKLGDYILDIAAGPFGSNLKVECFVPSGFPIIDGANLRGFKVTDNVTKFVTEEKARSLYRSIAKRNDVVVTISGNVGQISYIPYNSKYKEYLVSQRQFRATFDTTKVHVPYLIYYFHTIEGQHKILSFANQTGVPALAQPLKNFKNIDVQLPPLSKQKQIASILSSLDEKIECNKHINDNLEQQAQALFKSWFVDFEPFKDGVFVKSELGMIPKGWKVVAIKDVFKINIGKTPPRKEAKWFTESKEDNVWVSIADMSNCGAFISNSSEFLTDEAIERFNIQMVEPNSILLSFKLTVGRVAIADVKLTTNEAIARFILPNNSYREFLYLYLKQYEYGKLGSTSSIATAVNSKTVKGMKLLLPTTGIIENFSCNARPLFEQIRIIQHESRGLAQLRDTLLPKLMSGKLETII